MGPLYVLLVAAILYRPSAGSEATITVTLAPQASSTAPSGLDSAQAVNTQRHNLFLLFDRYGESNQSMTLAGFRKLIHSLGVILKSNHTKPHHDHHHPGHPHHHNHHHHHHPHHHRDHHSSASAPVEHGHTTCEETRKRRHVAGPERSASVPGTAGGAECLNASRLLTVHGMDMHMLLGAHEFGFICPAIINQIDRASCVPGAEEEHMAENSQVVYSKKKAWIGGFIAITIISVLSLLGIILVPLMNKVFFKFLLSFLVALAVGTLSGDAFLHLLPHNQKKNETEEELEIKKQLSNHSHIEEKEASESGSHHETYAEGEAQDGNHFQSGHPDAHEEEEEEVMIAHSHDETSYREYVSRGCENKCHSHFHDTLGQSDDLIHHHHDYHHILHHHHHQNHHPHSHSQRYSREELKDAGIATLAWMVIMGDGLHNFSDGLAIGAAFTEGLSSGLSTAVAVFCHELPHELGDFAILLKAGMTVRQALLYNALSAMFAYLGMITGILIGHYAGDVSVWIFALTAGLFMYVAFVDMVPEMLHNDASDHGCSRWGYFLLQNAGIILGFLIMLAISLLEHKNAFAVNL
ncbi:zinc transporter ZIP6 isoform X2 [Phyllobates terribilis]|uniref:zinc transporter ZIP6 isoform X2 n=1 Tax=Phyllobates terribilis TaxID=111132 RepID=UPI003CCB2F46